MCGQSWRLPLMQKQSTGVGAEAGNAAPAQFRLRTARVSLVQAGSGLRRSRAALALEKHVVQHVQAFVAQQGGKLAR
jgi:hypothetical protein